MENKDLKNKIDISREFQYSINIGFDINNDEKIKSFIPTTASLSIIEDILLSTSDSSTDRARILIGAYGKGKSHIILVLLSLLNRKDIKLFDKLLSYIKNYNKEMYDYTVNYINSKKRLLPVIIQNHTNSLTEAFLSAIQKALETEGLEDLMPETHFHAAVDRINNWKEQYNDTYEKFISLLDEPISEFMIKLMGFNVETYEKFLALYPSLTSGSIFNPFFGFDVIELYTKVIEKIKTRGYNGIFIVYDEFSKFLEAGINKINPVDIKLLQDFAEKCNRSKNEQMHLLLISHKDISNYIDKLPKQKVDGWKGVSERFKHIEIHNNFYQIYEIISTIINKDDKYFSKFYSEHNEKFTEMVQYLSQTNLFSEFTDEQMKIVTEGCYPLHPISTFILPRLSEKVAQNERTLFTFLSSRNKNTLYSFIEGIDISFPMLTPDYIYDYFEPLLRKEVYTSEVYKIYSITTNIINKLEPGSLGSKIIKTIALIYLIGQFEKLPPTPDIIINSYKETVADISEITKALIELQEERYVIYMKKSNKYLKLKNSIGIDIGSKISDTVEKNKALYRVKNILNNILFDNYMYPTSYNDDFEITRYFDFTFIDGEEFLSIKNWDKKIERSSADGVVYGIIIKDIEEKDKITQSLTSTYTYHDRIVFALLQNEYDIERVAFEYQAVINLKSETDPSDEALIEEYNVYIEDLEETLKQFISFYTKPEKRQSLYYYKGSKHAIFRKAQISQLLSKICADVFNATPIINNESINKDFLPTVAINSRGKVINGLLNNKLEPLLGISGTGQEISILRSTLVMTGVLIDFETHPKLIISSNPNIKMQNVIDKISNFFKESSNNKPVSFDILYEKLTKAEYHIGMKKGVIPIYIAAVLHFFKKYAVITRDNRELEINVDLLNSINENPAKYYFYLEDWDEEKSYYIKKLEEIFCESISENEKEYNNFAYIVKAMQRWFIGLPKYAKELKMIYIGNGEYREVDKQIIKYANSLKIPEINAREYLFVKLFNIFKLSPVDINIISKIQFAKDLLDNSKDNLIKSLIADVRSVFINGQPNEAVLNSIIRDWYESLQEETRNHLFITGEERILELIKVMNNDDKHFTERLAKLLTGLRVDDWENDTVNIFNNTIKTFKENVEKQDEAFCSQESNNDINAYKISYIDKDGKEITKTFDKTEYSGIAKLLFNEITSCLDEYGHAITLNEKRQVLMEIIEKLC